jgi:hypothetical protein
MTCARSVSSDVYIKGCVQGFGLVLTSYCRAADLGHYMRWCFRRFQKEPATWSPRPNTSRQPVTPTHESECGHGKTCATRLALSLCSIAGCSRQQMYEGMGYVRIPLFGEDLSSPYTSLCFGKELIK